MTTDQIIQVDTDPRRPTKADQAIADLRSALIGIGDCLEDPSDRAELERNIPALGNALHDLNNFVHFISRRVA